MRLSLASLACCLAVVSAQYLSEGWTPGQAATPTREFAAAFTPAGDSAGGEGSPQVVRPQGFMDTLLAKFGINGSTALTYEDLWDTRIPFIHDDNYEDVIVNEQLTPEEEAERLWFLIITTAAGQQQQGGVSKLVDAQFDEAYNVSLIENDLPSVRWGRVDYLNVTYLTTKWNVWRGPFLVVLKDRGQSLRFYHANQIRLNSTIMRTFLKEEGWKHTEPWSSSFGPGGSREFILHYFAVAMVKLYSLTVRVPKFVLMIVTGALGSVIMGLLHRGKPAQSEKPAAKPQPAIKAAAEGTSSATSSPAKKGSVKNRKGGKK